MPISAKRMAILREHVRAESVHDMDALIGGMTQDCFNDVVGVPEPFVGPAQTAERYRKHWEGFPDFAVRVRRIASAVRDRLSADTWRILSQLQEDFHLRHARIRFDDVLGILNRMITDLAAFSGMEMENMTRGHGWRFLDVGRRLERSVNLTSL